MSDTAHPLGIRDYRLVWVTRFLSVSAMTGVVVVIGAQTYQIARTGHGMAPDQAAFLLGLLGLAQFVPFMLLTPVAGLLADRLDRRYLGAAALAIDLAIAVVLAVANARGVLSLPLLFGLAATHGAARVFIGPSVSAIVPNVVPAALLPKAIAVSSIAWQSAAVIGPAAGGVLLARDAALPYAVAAGLLVLAIAAILSIKPIARPAISKEPPLRQIAEGAKFVWHERFLLGCVTLDLFAVLLGGATAMLPAFAYDVLHVGDEGLGLMRAAAGTGRVCGRPVAQYRANQPQRRRQDAVGGGNLWRSDTRLRFVDQLLAVAGDAGRAGRGRRGVGVHPQHAGSAQHPR